MVNSDFEFVTELNSEFGGFRNPPNSLFSPLLLKNEKTSSAHHRHICPYLHKYTIHKHETSSPYETTDASSTNCCRLSENYQDYYDVSPTFKQQYPCLNCLYSNYYPFSFLIRSLFCFPSRQGWEVRWIHFVVSHMELNNITCLAFICKGPWLSFSWLRFLWHIFGPMLDAFSDSWGKIHKYQEKQEPMLVL